ncbi:MAG: hypothetical protein WAV04_03290 [Candidatus Microsaccharimonas sp.]
MKLMYSVGPGSLPSIELTIRKVDDKLMLRVGPTKREAKRLADMKRSRLARARRKRRR